MRLTGWVVLIASVLVSSGSEPPNGRIVAISGMRVARANHAQILLSDGEVFIAGGFSGSGGETVPYSSTEFFEPRTGTFRNGPDMAVGRSGATATGLVDGRVLLAGGWTGSESRGETAELLDPRTNAIHLTGRMLASRAGHTATRLLDGRVLITGGRDASETSLASAELYDPQHGTFSAAGSMLVPRSSHAATRLADGRVLITGGSMGRYPAETTHATLEIYDPATGRFGAAGRLMTARYKHAAVRFGDGSVLIVGGSDNRAWNGQLASTEVCDAIAKSCRAGPEMREERFKLPGAVAALRDGSVLIVGGGADGELLDRTGTRLVTVPGSLGAARYFSSATELHDGRVLITGGYAEERGGLPATRAAHLYEPGPGVADRPQRPRLP
jgi:Galactose oxidase, central domain